MPGLYTVKQNCCVVCLDTCLTVYMAIKDDRLCRGLSSQSC